MSPKLTTFLTALLVCALSAIIGWLGGYDFDERNAGVALWATITAISAIALGFMAGLSRELEIAEEKRSTTQPEE